MNRREEEMDEQLEVFNKRVNQQLLGFVDARSFFYPLVNLPNMDMG